MEFHHTEIIFYAAVAMSGIVGGTIRLARDRVSYGIAGNVGRFLSSGLVSFGAVGIWLGPDTLSIDNPFYYMAIASSIGYASHDVQERIFAKLIDFVVDKFGGDKSNKNDQG